MSRYLERQREPETWLSENRRSLLAAVLGALVALPLARWWGAGEFSRLASVDLAVFAMSVYLTLYLAVTAWAQGRSDPAVVQGWARRQGRGTWYQRYVAGTSPGPGLAISVGALALLTGVVWLPRGEVLGSVLPVEVRITLGAALIAVAWLTMTVSFAAAYRAEDLLEDDPTLRFPGDDVVSWADYLSVATTLSTSFGTSDVTIVRARTRRTAAVHAVVAFVYNTVILGVVVSTVASL